MLALLIFGFAAILVAHAFATRRLATGQTAFTSLWLVSAIVLMGFPKSVPYLTWGGVALMVGVHAAYLVGSLAIRPRSTAPPTVFEPTPALAHAIRWVYGGSLVLAGIGVGMLIAVTGAWQIVNGVSAAAVRYVELDANAIPILPRVLSNFLLVPVALAPAMSVVAGGRGPRLRFYALPFLCLLGQSVAFGGRGGVTFGGLLLVWGFATARSQGYFARLDRRSLTVLGGLVLALLAYSQGIFASRAAYDENGFGFGEYLGLPIPAGCEALAENPDQPTLAFGFNNLAPVREGLRALGVPQESRVDDLVVLVPVPYNVFTSVLEGVMAFGYAGVLLLAFGLGLLGGWLETGRQTLVTLAARSLLYCYLGMTLFADLAFFYTGWSLALLLVGVGIPWLARSASGPRRALPSEGPA